MQGISLRLLVIVSTGSSNSPCYTRQGLPHDTIKDMPIGFGKHRGKMMSELVKEDPGYCQWVLEKADDPESSGRLLEAADAGLLLGLAG